MQTPSTVLTFTSPTSNMTFQQYPPLSICRQSVDADVGDILKLRTNTTKVVFGDVNVRNCIEKCVCKTLLNKEDELVAFMVVSDHPNIPVLAYCNWINWIRRFYRIDFASPWNTLFIQYLVWDPRYPNFITPVLKSMYKNNVKLEQIMMIVPPKSQIFAELESTFTGVYPRGEGVGGTVQTLYLNLRQQILPKLIIRKAAEEDNIDVQPLVYHQMEVLKYVFGDFKLRSVIDLKDPQKAILVAEKTSSVTVGVLSTSSVVDYSLMNCFFYHVLDMGENVGERVIRCETTRSDSRRGLFPPETFSTVEDTLSLDMNLDKNQSLSEEDPDEDEDRDELVVYWDVDGDMFRIVDPVMEYLFLARKRGVQQSQTQDEDITRQSQTSRMSSADFTYWGRPSWSVSFPLNSRSSHTGTLLTRDRVGTTKDQTPNSYLPSDCAFAITLFALHPDLDVRYGFDLLEASFECFPDRHFCLLSLPTSYQGSPLTQHMVRMSPRMSRDFPHELYITHRNAIFSEFTVRPITIVDHLGVSELVDNLSAGKRIRNDIVSILLQENSGIKGFVLECERNIVGVAVVTTSFGLHQMQPHYKIEQLIHLHLYDWLKHGLVRHLIVCPVFLKAGPFFLRQIMHQTGMETLSYCLVNDDIASLFQIDISLITLLEEMTPVKPRKRVQYDLSALDIYTPEKHVVHQEQDFALFITTEKLLSVQKLELNYRIVVVGASDTAMSFLENLIFRSARKHIRYNNLILVSIHGFPLELRPHAAGDKMLSHCGVYTREYLARISLSTHINVLYGALSIINRKEKMICLNEEHWLRYDYLFLFTGMQFCKPWPEPEPEPEVCYTKSSTGLSISESAIRDDRDYPKQDCHKNDDIRDTYNRANLEYGDNIFVVNTSTDAVLTLAHLKKILKNKKQGKIVICGNCLDMYTCVQSLLVYGVPGHKIVMVVGPTPSTNHCLETNPFVEKTVMETMEEVGVTVYTGYSLIRWFLRHKSLHRVMFRNSQNIPLSLECIALFYFGAKVTNAKTYLAANDAGIVYNNGIIINTQFRTNDEYIFAAGPGTRYSNKHQPTEYDHHAYYNSEEVGLKTSYVFRQIVEPRPKDYVPSQKLPQESSIHSDDTSLPLQGSYTLSDTTVGDQCDSLPVFREPTFQVAQLPGGWNYVKISTPGRQLPLECQLHGQGDSGPVLITGVPILADGPGYFQLSFSIYNTVREIVLLSKKEIPYQNLGHLYGKHERLLNNLYEQYNQGFILDLYAFFSQPWAYALYTSRFNKMAGQCAEIFLTSENIGLPHFHKLTHYELLNLLRQIKTDQESISHRYLTSSVPIYVEHMTLKFISDYRLQLPMYFTDALLASTYQSTYNTSPLHKDSARSRLKSKTSQRES